MNNFLLTSLYGGWIVHGIYFYIENSYLTNNNKKQCASNLIISF